MHFVYVVAVVVALVLLGLNVLRDYGKKNG